MPCPVRCAGTVVLCVVATALQGMPPVAAFFVWLIDSTSLTAGVCLSYPHFSDGRLLTSGVLGSSLASCLLPSCVLVLAGLQVTLVPASSSNPGIPPSSLMSFLRVNASIAGLVLTEFDSSIQDPLYASRFDQGGRVNATDIAGVAAAVAAGLVRIAGGDPVALKVREGTCACTQVMHMGGEHSATVQL